MTTIHSGRDPPGIPRKAADGADRQGAVCPEKERDLWGPHVPEGARTITFGPGGDLDVSLPDKLVLGKGALLTVMWKGRVSSVQLPGTFLAPSYATALLAGLAAAGAMGLDMEQAVSSLSTFKGVPGRGDVAREGGAFLIRERNPGVSAGSIDWNITVLSGTTGKDIGWPGPCKPEGLRETGREEPTGALQAPVDQGQYIINMPGLDRQAAGFLRIEGPMDVGRSTVLVHCIKEGTCEGHPPPRPNPIIAAMYTLKTSTPMLSSCGLGMRVHYRPQAGRGGRSGHDHRDAGERLILEEEKLVRIWYR